MIIRAKEDDDDAIFLEPVKQKRYRSGVGMLLYLVGHTRPDITYAVTCCARYMFGPRRIHELALNGLDATSR